MNLQKNPILGLAYMKKIIIETHTFQQMEYNVNYVEMSFH